MPTARAARTLDLLAEAVEGDPFGVLGPHPAARDGHDGIVLRTIQPGAARVELLRVTDGHATPARELSRVHPVGIFELFVPGSRDPFPYRFRVHSSDGPVRDVEDPYRFPRVMGDIDLHLFGEGNHLRLWERLGAHPMTIDGVAGIYFAVWAPNAERVSIVGDWNQWDGRVHPMRVLFPNGIWELFVPGLQIGAHYKFEIKSSLGPTPFLKADPYARYAEQPPATASIAWDASHYTWRDGEWMARRGALSVRESLSQPMAVYEVHLGSWRHHPDGRPLSYRELARELVAYVREMGFTHIELMPVLEHPFTGSWGYQVTGFFAPTSRFGPPEDFKHFVDECHVHGIGVILDWVPGHFPKDAYALAKFDGSALYEHADPRQGEHQDWGTLIFNYGRNEVRNFLLSSALFWLEEFHIDGLRVDAVASMLYLDYSRVQGQWIPNRYGGRENLDAVYFLRQMNELTHGLHPGTITIAEESTSWPAVSRPAYVGGLGFTYKWNMGWMHDILEYMKKDPIHRRWNHNLITFSLVYAWSENFILPFSHDEVVHLKGSMIRKIPGDDWQGAATLRALYGYMYAHPGKKLLFMGDELAEWREWNEDAELAWEHADGFPHAGTRRFVRDLNRLYQREAALHQIDFDSAGFSWIDCNDNENSVISLLRRAHDPRDTVVVVVNFTPLPRVGYRVGVPTPGIYRELLNSDGAEYGGSNQGNGGQVRTEDVKAHGHEQSLSLLLPPLATLFLKGEP